MVTAARDLGFALAGVAPAEPSAYEAHVRAWLAAGHHGEMGYLDEHLEKRLDPRQLVPGARAVICVADRYPAQAPQELAAADDGAPRGRLARYAWGDDYHKVLKKRLFRLADALRERWPGHTYQACTDTAPVLEHEHAARAGIGFTGKHTLTIHPRLGSWLLLGEIVTTLPTATSGEAAGVPAAEPLRFFGDGFQGCGTCTRCIDACPTDCIRPYTVDAERCISYLTLEHRGPIDPALHEPMGDWIGGCDVCQAVCPFNRPLRLEAPAAQPEPEGDDGEPAPGEPLNRDPHPRYTPRPPAPSMDLRAVLDFTAEDRAAALRGSALKRMKLPMLKRNALIAAGNHLREREDAELRRRIERLAEDETEDELVRHTAQQVLDRLTQK